MKKIVLLTFLLLIAHAPAWASTGYYLVSTYGEEGEKTVDFKFWNVKTPDAPATRSPEIGFGYGVTKRWFSELYLTYSSDEKSGTNFSGANWQNDYLLTQGQYPFDLALHTNIERFRDGNRGYGVEFGPVLQTEFGKTQLNLNLFFERNYRAEQANAMQMKYQWQLKYRAQPTLAFGLQGFGELGEWNHWDARDQQSHRIGPAVFGMLPLAESKELKFEAAYFFGSVSAVHANTFSMRVQYEF